MLDRETEKEREREKERKRKKEMSMDEQNRKLGRLALRSISNSAN